MNQLLGLVQNPAFLQSILGQAMGPAGKSTVRVGRGGSAATFGSFMNALSQLATQAAIEADDAAENITESYLFDKEGNALCDTAVPERRAEVLLEQLREAPLEQDTTLRESDALVEWFVEAGWLDPDSI